MSDDHRSILSSASLVSGLTLFSRLLGVIRDAAIAGVLGASVFNDIFNIAFEIPNLARRVLGEGALSAFIVPIYHREQKTGGQTRAFLFFNRAITVMALIGGGLTAAGLLLSRPIFLVFGAKYLFMENAETYVALGAHLTRVMFPFLLFLTLASLFMGACHAHRRFLTPALGSSVLNVSIIVTAWLYGFSDSWANATPEAAVADAQAAFTVALAWAVIVGVVVRLLLMVVTLIRLGWRYRPQWRLRDPAMTALFGKMGAASFAAGLAQINITVNIVLATWCGEGAVTYLRFSNRLVQLPLALLASSLATALAPTISSHTVNGRTTEARDAARFAVRVLTILIIPAMVGFWALGQPIVAMIFQRGQWTAEASRAAAFALSMYTVGLAPLAVTRLYIPIFYAKGDVRTPVKVAAGALVVNIVANLILMRTPLSYAGLALGSSLAAIFNAAVLWALLRRDLGPIWEPRLALALAKCLAASAVMGAACWTALRYWTAYWPPDNFAERFVQVGALCALGAAVYFAVAVALRTRDIQRAFALVVKRKVGKETKP